MSKSLLITRKICLFAMLLSIGWMLPVFTGRIPEIGSMISPMHLPVLICGFVLGKYYGGLLGIILPISSSLMFGMPPLYPMSLAMAIEMGIYGLISGLIFELFVKIFGFNNKIIIGIFVSLFVAIVLGRISFGIAMLILNSIKGNTYTFAMWISASFIKGFVSILIQMILVPSLVFALIKTKMLNQFYDKQLQINKEKGKQSYARS